MLFERPEAGHHAVILYVELNGQANPELSEFAELAASAEIDVVDVVTARRDQPHPRTYVGSGKVSEIRAALKTAEADLLLINHELSAGQQRNLEMDLNCRVITRTELILTIFADRARSHEGQLQVELAQLKHAQTRLVRGWTHLDRQKGGIGLRGAGEKQIELDQRMLGERIKATEKKLATVSKRRNQNRRGRNRRGTPTITLVGYTNAGKSTLFNRMTDASVYAEDQLFATLDPTMRRVAVPGVRDAVLADTVGFVSLLPHALVEAFKATLEEVVHADLLLHVVDAADPLWEERIEQVSAVLEDIGAHEVPQLLVFNKIDLCSPEHPTWRQMNSSVYPVSARDGSGVDALIAGIGDALGVAAPHEVVLDSADGRTRAWLYRSGAVIEEQTMEDGSLHLTLQADDALLAQLRTSSDVLLRRNDAVHKISTVGN
jgi:GTP-binding protein HflX